jgi:hypothetical protein
MNPMLRALACAAGLAFAAGASAEKIDSPREVDAVLAVSDVRVDGDAIAATLTNRGAHPLRDVRLLVEYVYHWPAEMKPGPDNPGRAWPHVVPGPIAPGASEPVRYEPAGGLPIAAGTFEPRIQVFGYTQVGE